MKTKLIKWSKPLLTACILLGTWVSFDIASLIFFGEYEYPTEE